MTIFDRIVRALKGSRSQDVGVQPLDAAPQPLEQVSIDVSVDWRKVKLAEAAQKHGKPFKCAGDDLPREVVVRGRAVAVDSGARRLYPGSGKG